MWYMRDWEESGSWLQQGQTESNKERELEMESSALEGVGPIYHLNQCPIISRRNGLGPHKEGIWLWVLFCSLIFEQVEGTIY